MCSGIGNVSILESVFMFSVLSRLPGVRPQARLVCPLVSLAVLLTVTVLPGQDVEFRRGDSNIDSRLDISDAVTIIGYLFLGDPDRCGRSPGVR